MYNKINKMYIILIKTGFIADMGSMTLDQTFKQFIKQNRPAIQRKFLNECMAQYTDYLKDV